MGAFEENASRRLTVREHEAPRVTGKGIVGRDCEGPPGSDDA